MLTLARPENKIDEEIFSKWDKHHAEEFSSFDLGKLCLNQSVAPLFAHLQKFKRFLSRRRFKCQKKRTKSTKLDPGNGLKSTRGSWGAIWALGSISGVLDPFSTLYEQEHWPKGWYLKENWWVLPTRWVSVTAASTSPPTVPKGFYPSSLRGYWGVAPHARSNFPVVSNLQICLIL